MFKIWVFSLNGNDWEREKTLGYSQLKLLRHDLQVLFGVFLINMEYWSSQDMT